MHAAETGSFASAARVLNISAAAVGQNIKRLEDAYGVKLFNRTTRKMSLTPEGTLLYERARGPLRELDELEDLFDESRGIVSGRLRLTAPKSFAMRTLVPLVAAFRARHPAVEIDIDASDSVRDFVDDPVDIAFRWGDPDSATMIARKIAALPVLTAASPDYLAARGTPDHPDDLVDHNCVQYRYPTSKRIWVWAYVVGGEIKRFPTKGNLIANDPDALLGAALSGAGLVQLDSYYVAEPIKSGELVPVLTEFAPTLTSLQICYPSRDHLPLRVRTFIDFALAEMPRDSFSLSAT